MARSKDARSKDAQTPTTTHDDGEFVRTALVIGERGPADHGSFDVTLPDGTRIGQINVFVSRGGDCFMVDVIDVEDRYPTRVAVAFDGQGGLEVRHQTEGTLVAAHFERGPE